MGLLVWGVAILAARILFDSSGAALMGANGGLILGVVVGGIAGFTGKNAGLGKFLASLTALGLTLTFLGAILGLAYGLLGHWSVWPAGGALLLGGFGAVIGLILGE